MLIKEKYHSIVMEIQPLFYTKLPTEVIYKIYDLIIRQRKLPVELQRDIIFTSYIDYIIDMYEIHHGYFSLKRLLLEIKLHKIDYVREWQMNRELLNRKQIITIIKKIWFKLEIEKKISFYLQCLDYLIGF